MTQSTLTIWVNRHGHPCDSDRHDARPIEVVPKAEVERLREAINAHRTATRYNPRAAWINARLWATVDDDATVTHGDVIA